MALSPGVVKKIVGTGLAEREAYASIDACLLLPLADITPNPDNPKTCQDGRLLQIANSIKRQGWVPSELPLVWENADGPTKYTLVNGEHRWLICKMAGFERFPAVIAKGIATKADAMALTMALEEARARRDKGKWAANLIQMAAEGRDEELRSILRVRDPEALRRISQRRQASVVQAQETASVQRASAPRLVSLTFTGAQYDAFMLALGKSRTRLKQASETNAMLEGLAEATDAQIVAMAAVVKNGRQGQ